MAEELRLPPEIERFHEKWRKEPTSRIFAQLADAYRKNGMLDEAIEVCREGLKVHPTYSSGRMVLARSYLEKGMEAEAELEFWEILKNDPDNILALRTLGDLLYRHGRIAEAIEQYQRCLRLTPLDRELRAMLERAETEISFPAAAPPAVESPSGPRERQDAAAAEVETGPPPAGEPIAAPEMGTEEEDAFLTETIADLYLRQGLYQRAVEIFTRMLASDPNNLHIQRRLQEALQLQEAAKQQSSLAETATKEEASEAEVPAAAMIEGIAAAEEPKEQWPGSFTPSAGVSEDEALSSGENPSLVLLERWLDAIRKRRGSPE